MKKNVSCWDGKGGRMCKWPYPNNSFHIGVANLRRFAIGELTRLFHSHRFVGFARLILQGHEIYVNLEVRELLASAPFS